MKNLLPYFIGYGTLALIFLGVLWFVTRYSAARRRRAIEEYIRILKAVEKAAPPAIAYLKAWKMTKAEQGAVHIESRMADDLFFAVRDLKGLGKWL